MEDKEPLAPTPGVGIRPQFTTGHRKRRRSTYISLTAGVLAIVVIASGLMFWRQRQAVPSVQVPASIANKALFDIYLPKRLPSGFAVNPDSFRYFDDTLIFSATDAGGRSIAFTEQSTPKDFDFQDFYRSMADSHKLSGAPFTSVAGTMSDKSKVLSITADDTWLIARTSVDIGASGFQTIASSLSKR